MSVGIEKLKSGLLLAITSGETMEKVLEDGKVDFGEWFEIAKSFKGIIGVVRSFPDMKEEFFDLDAAEKQDLVDYVKEELDLVNDDVEIIIESVLAFVSSMSAMFVQFSQSKEKIEE